MSSHEPDNTRRFSFVRPMPAPQHGAVLQRKCACGGTPGPTGECEECRSKRLQRKADEGRRQSLDDELAPPIVQEALRSPGQPLDIGTRAFFEPRFGHDFSHVRVHTDAKAAESARAVNALAYTVGRDVAFGAGQYSPDSHQGGRLLAHELAHVMQQGGSAGSGGLTIGPAATSQELSADRAVEQVMASPHGMPEPAPSLALGGVNRSVLMRKPEINAGNGTTEELQRELDRLREEAKTASVTDQFLYQQKIGTLETYIAERGSPTGQDCPFSLFFGGTTLSVSGAITADFPAVSGEPDKAGHFDYSPEKQRQPGGPIPEGEYWILPAQLKMLGFSVPLIGDIRLRNAPKGPWGDYRVTIHPFDSTHTFGRGGFFIHGGATPGSIGCIDLTNKMDDFAHLIDRYIQCKVRLTVRYPKVVPDPTYRLQPGTQVA